MIGVVIVDNRRDRVSIKDCGEDVIYAIKKILTYSKKADIDIKIEIHGNKNIKGQVDFDGNIVV